MTSGWAGSIILIAGLSPRLASRRRRARSGARSTTRAEIKPLLSKRCYACHGALQQKAVDCALDTAALTREEGWQERSGDRGPARVTRASSSMLSPSADGWRMPPESEGSPLSADEIARIKAWIDQGAWSPADEVPQPDPRLHWSFQPIRRPEVPSATALGSAAGWVRNPTRRGSWPLNIVLRGLEPRPAADPATLIRRVCLDLTGAGPEPCWSVHR